MKSFLASSFLQKYALLPPEVRALARKNYKLWKENPTHRSLQYKRVGRRTNSFSVRIGIAWRAVGVQHDDEVVWFWIGSHAEYDRIVDSL